MRIVNQPDRAQLLRLRRLLHALPEQRHLPLQKLLPFAQEEATRAEIAIIVMRYRTKTAK